MSDRRISLTLFLLRLSVFLVMLVWSLDKFIQPEHAAAVFKTFYFIGGLNDTVIYIIGAVQLAIVVGFLLGWRKRITYGLVFLFHAVSTLSAFSKYLAPYQDVNLLFFAAWPMLAACFALYTLRDLDTLFAIDR
ncbi:hypothetical protein AY599_27120 [Leptolyngbya valderiana BDU 20041]|nr:hypothetical protein [Geitlerinema sp. CS-897]OAB62724.1 hypothetical protein AY599_27120 [Leptolyngbya valderiana BDU 20041]PPT10244.1 putative conserved membrane protein [Geitlerinema sp. FC II]